MDNEKILVTGATGCIGSWVLRHLSNQGANFIASDLSTNKSRPALLLSEDELQSIHWMTLDVTDGAAVQAAVADNGVTRIVHLAGLQVPFTKANPPLGAAVNVVGTTNIFEAARLNAVTGVSYASSIAVFGPPQNYPQTPIRDDAPARPDTLYGVFKVANEETARLYWQDWGVGSVGLRPGVVYGAGRDQGLTSDVAKALLAIAANEPFHIRFDGLIAMQHASDVAEMFIKAARAGYQGAAACNLRNDVIELSDFVGLIGQKHPDAKITFKPDSPLPVPADYDDSGLGAIIGPVPHIALADAMEQDIARYRTLLESGKIDLAQLAD